MLLEDALPIANKCLADLMPYCERAEIAGSIRRQKPEVKDIEIVVIPKTETVNDLFGDPAEEISLLENAMSNILKAWDGWTLKNGQKYKQILLPGGMKLDLFIVTKETWGVQFTLRTGSAEYSHWLVTQRRYGGALPSHAKIEGGRIVVHGKQLETPEEKDFFAFLEIPMPAPSERTMPQTK